MTRWRYTSIAGGVAILGAALTGCGVARSPATVSAAPRLRASAAMTPKQTRAEPWPPGGSRQLARSVGRRMLASLVFPPGSRHVGARPVPERAEVIGSRSLVDLSSFFIVPMPVQAAARFLTGHPPAGLAASGTGTTSSRRGVVDKDVSFGLQAPPAGIASDTELLVTLGYGPRGATIARADAEVVWYPPRTAAEYLRPSAIWSARITASFLNPRLRHVAKVITSSRAIARLAALLNRMRATDNSVRMCPMIDASYRISFTRRAGQPRVVVDATGCATDGVVVDGKAQPPLWDPANHLIHALHGLLGLSQRWR